MTVTSHTGFERYSYSVSNEVTEKEDIEGRLKKLQDIYDRALITREEYDQKRKEILEDL